MKYLKRLSTLWSKSSYSDEELIEMIRQGGTARRRAVIYLHDACLGYVHKMIKKYAALEEDAIIAAYAKALTEVVNKLELNNATTTGKRQRISSFIYQVFQQRTIDLYRQYKSQQKKTHLEFEGLIFDDFSNDKDGSVGSNQRQKILVDQPADELVDVKTTTLTEEEYMMSEEFVREAMRELSAQQRQILFDKMDGYSNAEIIKRNGLADSVKLSHAMYAIRKKVKDKIEQMHQADST